MTAAVAEKIAFSFPAEVVKQTEEAGQFHVVGYAATSDFDLQGDIITEDALKNASQDLITNSTVLLNHDITQPIGKVTKAELDPNGLLIDALISKTEPDIIQKIKEGILNKFSIRGEVIQRDKKYVPELDRVANVIERLTLLEVSVVSVPANPEARAIGWYLSKALREADAKNQGGSAMSDDAAIEEIPQEEKMIPQPEKSKPVEIPAEQPAPPQTPDPMASEVTKAQTPKPAGPDDPDDDETEAPDQAAASAGKRPKVRKDAAADQPAADQEAADWDWDFEQAVFLLDTLIAIGAPVGPIAQQVKALVLSLVEGDDTMKSADPKQPVPEAPMPEAAAAAISEPATVVKAQQPGNLAEMISAEVKKQVEAAVKAMPPVRKGVMPTDNEAEAVHKAFESLSPERKLKVALALQHN